MPTTEANPTLAETKKCPLCDTPLRADNPSECPKCDWVLGLHEASDNTRDVIAVFLSVVPGLGHIYKGHRLSGALYMIGSAFAFFAVAVAATFTAGWALLLMPLYWAGVMLQVYWLDDRVAAAARKG